MGLLNDLKPHLFDPAEHLAALVGSEERVTTYQLETVGEGG